jgi:Uma2 family endonuclease
MATKAKTAEIETFADLLEQIGDVPPERIRMRPPPGTATEQDVLAARGSPQRRLCELVDGVLVEKPMATQESLIGSLILHRLWDFLDENDLGNALGGDGILRLMPGSVRIPDVSFIAWERWRAARSAKIAPVAPDLAVEVLSESNTRKEIQRKLRDYFLSGTQVVWVVQPKTETAQVYTSPADAVKVGKNGTLDGGSLLPGFSLALKDLFRRANRTGREGP